jgi:DNA-binding MurR/RpiR family transcriptional regulator
MAELASEARPLVEAGKALDIGLPRPSAQEAGSGDGVSPVVQAYAKSIQEDAKALKALSAALLLQEKDAKLRHAVKLIAEAHTDKTESKAHVYLTGIGKSGLVAMRLAASLRSISIRSSHVSGNEWVRAHVLRLAWGCGDASNVYVHVHIPRRA